jgi:hypothetical protein
MSQAGIYEFTITPPIPGIVSTLTGNDAIVVGPNAAGNINVVGGNNITVTGNAGTNTETFSVTGTTNHAVQVGNASGSLTSIPVGTTGQVLTGVTGANPVFEAPAASIISITGDSGGTLMGNSFTFTGGATGLTFSGSGTTEMVVGTLVVSHGGTGATTLTSDSILLGNGTSAVTALGAATNGQLPIGNTGNPPTLATLTAGTGVTVVNGAGAITISSSNTLAFTSVTTTPYVVLTTDDFLGVTTTTLAITIELPNSPATGRIYTIKDSTGNSATHNITVTTVGGTDLIDGATTFVMNTAYESINALFDGAAWEIF